MMNKVYFNKIYSNLSIFNCCYLDIEIPIATVDTDLESAIEQSNKINGNTKMSKSLAPYVYIDHEKTVTLKDIVNERLQQQKARRMEN